MAQTFVTAQPIKCCFPGTDMKGLQGYNAK